MSAKKSGRACLLILVIVVPTLLIMTPTASGETFKTKVMIHLYIDEDGNAHVREIETTPPSALADCYKQAIKADGIEPMEEVTIRGVRDSLERYGLELEDPSYSVEGLGERENFVDTLKFKIPNFAEWKDNQWIIERQWVKPEKAAQEVIDKWKTLQSLLTRIQPGSQLRIKVWSASVLPENARIIKISGLDNRSRKIDYGGGSYENSIVHIGNVEGNPAIIKESEAFIVSHTSITITPEELAYQRQGWSVKYTGVPPPSSGSPNLLLYAGIGVVLIVILVVILFRRRGGEEWIESGEEW